MPLLLYGNFLFKKLAGQVSSSYNMSVAFDIYIILSGACLFFQKGLLVYSLLPEVKKKKH